MARNKILRYSFFVFFLFVCPFAYSSDKIYGDIAGVVYVGNYDGDTITFDIPGVHPLIGDKITVRVYGIDTPEINGKCEKEKRLSKEAKEVVHVF